MTMPAGSIPGRWYSVRLVLVAQALTAVGAVGADVAEEIQADIGLAVAARHRLFARGPGPGRTRPAPRRTSWRVVSAGQVITIRDGALRRELPLVACVQSAGGARFLVTEWPFRPFTFTAADDRGSATRSPGAARWHRASCSCARTRRTRSAGLTSPRTPGSPPPASTWTRRSRRRCRMSP